MKKWWLELPWWTKRGDAAVLIIGKVARWPWSLRGLDRWDACEQQWADTVGLGTNGRKPKSPKGAGEV